MGFSEGNSQMEKKLRVRYNARVGGAGVSYSLGVGWVGEKRYECSGMISEWNAAYEGSLER